MPTREATRQRRKALLLRAKRVIQARYSETDLGLAEVAAEVGTSPRQLQRVFREEAGEDFRGVLLDARMRQAHRLLSRQRNPLPVWVVAPRVGYRQASGLRQAFKRFYGFNPSEVQPPPPAYVGNWEAPSRPPSAPGWQRLR